MLAALRSRVADVAVAAVILLLDDAPGVALCVSVLPIMPSLNGLTPSCCSCDQAFLERVAHVVERGEGLVGSETGPNSCTRLSFSKPHSSSVAPPTPGRHSESPLCWFISTSGSMPARKNASAGGERAAVGVHRREHQAAAGVRVVRDRQHVAAAAGRPGTGSRAASHRPCGRRLLHEADRQGVATSLRKMTLRWRLLPPGWPLHS